MALVRLSCTSCRHEIRMQLEKLAVLRACGYCGAALQIPPDVEAQMARIPGLPARPAAPVTPRPIPVATLAQLEPAPPRPLVPGTCRRCGCELRLRLGQASGESFRWFGVAGALISSAFGAHYRCSGCHRLASAAELGAGQPARLQAARAAMILFAAGLFAGILWLLVALNDWGGSGSRRTASVSSPPACETRSYPASQAQVEAMARMRELANRYQHQADAVRQMQAMAARQAAMNAAAQQAAQQARMDAARYQQHYRGR